MFISNIISQKKYENHFKQTLINLKKVSSERRIELKELVVFFKCWRFTVELSKAFQNNMNENLCL